MESGERSHYEAVQVERVVAALGLIALEIRSLTRALEASGDKDAPEADPRVDAEEIEAFAELIGGFRAVAAHSQEGDQCLRRLQEAIAAYARHRLGDLATDL